MRRAWSLAAAVVLAGAVVAPVQADALVTNTDGMTASWGVPVSTSGGLPSYSPQFQFWATRHTGTPDSEGSVGVRHSVGFGWTQSYCDTTNDEWVTVFVGVYGPPPRAWAYVDPDSWTVSRTGMHLEATLDLGRMTTRASGCAGPRWPSTSIVEQIGPATFVADVEVTGRWDRFERCTGYADSTPPVLSRTTGWSTSSVAASLTVYGSVEVQLGRSTLLGGTLSTSHDVLAPPDKGQPWECVPG